MRLLLHKPNSDVWFSYLVLLANTIPILFQHPLAEFQELGFLVNWQFAEDTSIETIDETVDRFIAEVMLHDYGDFADTQSLINSFKIYANGKEIKPT